MWCESNDVVYFVQKIVIFGKLSFLRERVIDTCIQRSSLLRARNLAIETLLKVEKIGIAITPRIITFNQRVSDR